MKMNKNSFGSFVLILLALILIVFVIGLLIGLIVKPANFTTLAPPAENLVTSAPLLAGMLGNPFRTTRKMKVPPHSRQGHAERISNKFAIAVFWIVFLVTSLGTILWLMSFPR